jgi:DNA mismatch repair protein MutS2
MVIASRLGLPSQIIAAAKSTLRHRDQEIETLLRDLTIENQNVAGLRSEVEKERAEAQNLRKHLQGELQASKEKERSILREAKDNLRETRDSLAREAAALRRQIREAESGLRKATSKERIEQGKRALVALHEKMTTPTWQVSQEDPREPTKSQNIAVGDKVWIRDMDLPGTVLSLHEQSNQVKVQVGRTSMVLNIEAVEGMGPSEMKPTPEMVAAPRSSGKTMSLELDLRGKRADEVAPELDRFLNDACLAHFTQVRIIHGFGTGTVRQIVRDILSSHPLAQSSRPGQKGEGGDGVTMVIM